MVSRILFIKIIYREIILKNCIEDIIILAMSLHCNKFQLAWIDYVKSNIHLFNGLFKIFPILKTGTNSLDSHYLKPIIVVDPEKQFGVSALESIFCGNCNKYGKLRSPLYDRVT